MSSRGAAAAIIIALVLVLAALTVWRRAERADQAAEPAVLENQNAVDPPLVHHAGGQVRKHQA